jgi:hypothetical protein
MFTVYLLGRFPSVLAGRDGERFRFSRARGDARGAHGSGACGRTQEGGHSFARAGAGGREGPRWNSAPQAPAAAP